MQKMIGLFLGVLVALSLLSQPAKAERTVEVGWIAACQSFDLDARLSRVQPKDYIVWLWNNRSSVPLCEGIKIDLVIYEESGGRELWRTSATTAIHRVKIGESLALKAKVMCAEVHGRKVTHADFITEKPGRVYASCTKRLPDSVREGRAGQGFGIPLIIKEKEASQ